VLWQSLGRLRIGPQFLTLTAGAEEIGRQAEFCERTRIGAADNMVDIGVDDRGPCDDPTGFFWQPPLMTVCS